MIVTPHLNCGYIIQFGRIKVVGLKMSDSKQLHSAFNRLIICVNLKKIGCFGIHLGKHFVPVKS